MTVAELATLSGPDLEAYFLDNARYYPLACRATQYQIRFGASWLRSDDTMDLRLQFERKVRWQKTRMALAAEGRK
jgi:hypothetical protein